MDRLGGAFGSLDTGDYEPEYDDTHTDSDPPSPVGQDERRMQVRAYNHWASLLGDGTLPDIEDLEPERLDDFGPYSVLLDFSTGIENPAVRFIGSELRGECDATGPIDRLSDVPPRSLLSRITDHYMQILANQAPIGFEAEYVNQRDVNVMYRGILLPYSSDDETIDFIFGVINWKETAGAALTDELLLEIDQAVASDTMADGDDDTRELETAETLTAPAQNTVEDDVFDLGSSEVMQIEANARLPMPRFGLASRQGSEGAAKPPLFTRRERGVDALGNKLGEGFDDNEAETANDEETNSFDESSFDGESFDGGMKTAADYGLPDWDDEPEDEDVDGLIDPLGDEESESSLISLVSRGEKTKKAVDLGAVGAFAIPQAYEPPVVEPAPAQDQPDIELEPDVLPAETGETDSDAWQDDTAEDPWAEARASFAGFSEAVPDPASFDEAEPEPVEPADEMEPIEADTPSLPPVEMPAEPAGLYDCLAEARELALAASSTEDRSRKALYEAVGRAYDFSLEATRNPDDFAEIMAENGLTMQDRAPMTPVVKLVFGADYDKTRLTEYAAVLTHAHRVEVARGNLAAFLREAEGGLKGVVQAERAARKEAQGKPVEQASESIRETLARKLRRMGETDFTALGVSGPEFALVMVRRTDDGRLVVVGELPEDRQTLEKAARKLLAK